MATSWILWCGSPWNISPKINNLQAYHCSDEESPFRLRRNLIWPICVEQRCRLWTLTITLPAWTSLSRRLEMKDMKCCWHGHISTPLSTWWKILVLFLKSSARQIKYCKILGQNPHNYSFQLRKRALCRIQHPSFHFRSLFSRTPPCQPAENVVVLQLYTTIMPL